VSSFRRRLALALTGISALFGMRTPPEPEAIAQMSPVKGPEGSGPEGFGTGRSSRSQLRLDLPPRRGVAPTGGIDWQQRRPEDSGGPGG
jgi:hypothetical protein